MEESAYKTASTLTETKKKVYKIYITKTIAYVIHIHMQFHFFEPFRIFLSEITQHVQDNQGIRPSQQVFH